MARIEPWIDIDDALEMAESVQLMTKDTLGRYSETPKRIIGGALLHLAIQILQKEGVTELEIFEGVKTAVDGGREVRWN